MMKFSPNSDQIELTLFGPGYGECVVVHLGENNWIIIDSCLDISTGKPAALEYFKRINVSVQDAVRLIVVSHWHDDHIRGLSEIVKSCPNTPVCLSSTLSEAEFLTYILDYKNLNSKTSYTGVKEIYEILELLKGSDLIKWASCNKQILNLSPEEIANSCVITALSPSEKEYGLFLEEIAQLIPQPLKTKKRAPSLRPNHAAVVLWIETCSIKILLGSDLEERNDSNTGWSAIVNSKERPRGRASIFKIPHHGSLTAHHDRVWTEMLTQSPFAVLSPFYLANTMLPTDRDIARIIKLAPKSYITTRSPIPRSRISRDPAVERTIRENEIRIRAVQPALGWVCLRNGGKSNPDYWEVELSPNASRLEVDSIAGHGSL